MANFLRNVQLQFHFILRGRRSSLWPKIVDAKRDTQWLNGPETSLQLLLLAQSLSVKFLCARRYTLLERVPVILTFVFKVAVNIHVFALLYSKTELNK